MNGNLHWWQLNGWHERPAFADVPHYTHKVYYGRYWVLATSVEQAERQAVHYTRIGYEVRVVPLATERGRV
jgi:hypothetical protein